MIKKFRFGSPFNTESVVKELPIESGVLPYFDVQKSDSLAFTYTMSDKDVVYGLGEAIRGINKRGWIYESFCSDQPNHSEEKRSLYGAHNFIIVDGEELFGAYFDYPGKITFDIGYTMQNTMEITSETADIDVYIITGDTPLDIVKQFREIIGRSYIAPFWAFGYQQSRWGYACKEDIENVVNGYKNAGIPLDAVYLDIDYMQDFKDFTVDEGKYPDFESFVADMKSQGVRLVPIIDAGVKIEDGYDIYEQGRDNGYFCKKEDGTLFVAGVWPGRTHFPDFLNSDARKWFGDKYKVLTDMGIEGFWNDMNEPAIFYSDEGLSEAFEKIKTFEKGNLDINSFFEARDTFNKTANSIDDYKRFYHNADGKIVRHYDVHNLYGYNMTRSAGEAFERIEPDKRILMFSRSSYIGMHRYSGIWTGDNHSWWSHILNHLRMMPSLNMCGFLYIGADLGGFGCDCTRDLLLRWLSLGVFTPLMRNHAALGTRDQECYRFENTEDFKNLIDFRYRLIPYLYSEYMKASLDNEMYFRPLAFDYHDDETARHIEDQLMVGEGLMIAPVYTQNALGRYVYLPDDMTQVRLNSDGSLTQSEIKKGHHFIEIPLNELVFFIKKGHMVPLCEPAQCTDNLDFSHFEYIGDGDSYTLYSDDGYSKDYDNPANRKVLKRFD